VKEPYERDDILQKRPIISRSLPIVATPYHTCVRATSMNVYMYVNRYVCNLPHTRVSLCSVEGARDSLLSPYFCKLPHTHVCVCPISFLLYSTHTHHLPRPPPPIIYTHTHIIYTVSPAFFPLSPLPYPLTRKVEMALRREPNLIGTLYAQREQLLEPARAAAEAARLLQACVRAGKARCRFFCICVAVCFAVCDAVCDAMCCSAVAACVCARRQGSLQGFVCAMQRGGVHVALCYYVLY